MKTNLVKIIGIVAIASLGLLPALSVARDAPVGSAKGKYEGLLQVMHCPADVAKYGNFTDYGYWKGGAWCGQRGEAGYWVWLEPNWYVWRKETPTRR
jgi:hypothetical protein